MASKIRVHVHVIGKVQGVYFRQKTMETAKENGVTGWVRNLSDGRVEAILEGDEASVNKVVDWCRVGPQRAEVKEVQSKAETFTGEFSDFVIGY